MREFRMRGRRVCVLDAGASGPSLDGVAVGIDGDGALRVAKDDGTEERVVAGDVTIAKEQP